MDANISLNHNMPNSENTLLPSGRHRSSSSSSLSTLSRDSLLNPETILQTGVPFSWEKLPGIPKSEAQQVQRKQESSSKTSNLLLPPPPAARLNRFSNIELRNKKTSTSRHAAVSKKDPFLAAFVECCRDDENHHQGSKNVKMPPTSTFQKFNVFSLYAICKTSGPVAESIVFIPKSNSLF